MKTVLILAYDFPPYNSIGGQRPYAWFKYFNENGIRPIVVTRHWDLDIRKPEDCYLPSLNQTTTTEGEGSVTVVRTAFTPNLRDRLIFKDGLVSDFIRKVLSLYQIIFEHLFTSASNKANIYKEARHMAQTKNIDCIVATGEPFVLFTYASWLSKEFDIPWVADYRDGWSTNYNHSSGVTSGLIRKWQRFIEKRVVRSASQITTAAPSFSEDVSRAVGKGIQKIPVVYNGYFHEMFEGTQENSLKKKFTISHAGTLYYFQRVETFLAGLNLFLSKNRDAEIEVNFYGLNFYPQQIDRIKKAAGDATVNFTDKIPHEEMLLELRSSHVQLLLAAPEKHQIYAKVFDYLGTGRPILMVENDEGPLQEILSSRENAAICSSAESVCQYLTEMYSDSSLWSSKTSNDKTFTRKNQTERFARLVLETIAK